MEALVTHIQRGPASAQDPEWAPLHNEVVVEIGEPRGDHWATFAVNTDKVTIQNLYNNGVEVVVHTGDAQSVVYRDVDSIRSVIDCPRESIRALFQWLGAAAKRAGDPVLVAYDPEDPDDEGQLVVLSARLDTIACSERLDRRVERDWLMEADLLPDDPEARSAYCDFFNRHFTGSDGTPLIVNPTTRQLLAERWGPEGGS
jgi:hypothetical protein